MSFFDRQIVSRTPDAVEEEEEAARSGRSSNFSDDSYDLQQRQRSFSIYEEMRPRIAEEPIYQVSLLSV